MLAPTWDFKTGNTWQQNSWAPWASQGAQNLFGNAQNWLQNNPWQAYGGPVSAGFVVSRGGRRSAVTPSVLPGARGTVRDACGHTVSAGASPSIQNALQYNAY
jgi:hypothetical protein